MPIPQECDHSLTTFAYMCTSTLAAAPLVPLALAYTPAGRARAAGFQFLWLLLGAMALTAAPALVGLAVSRQCAPLAADAASLGLACGWVYVLMYIPQLAKTASAHGSQSLSNIFLGLHIVLGVGAAVQKAKGTHERVLTWAPPLVANAMQAALLGMQLYYDAERHNAAALAADGEAGEAAPLAGDVKGGGYGAAGGEPRAAKGPRSDEVRFSREWWLRFM